MYLDYDTAPAQIKARLIKIANMSVNDRSRIYVSHNFKVRGKTKTSKYDGFLYQKKGKNHRTSPVFFDKVFDSAKLRKKFGEGSGWNGSYWNTGSICNPLLIFVIGSM